jgi:hypothetical protein
MRAKYDVPDDVVKEGLWMVLQAEWMHCPSWPGGVARSAGVMVQMWFKCFVEFEPPPLL